MWSEEVPTLVNWVDPHPPGREGRAVIELTRLNEQSFVLNTDLIERVEATPDTVLTLVDGTRYIVREPLEAVVDRVIEFRARVIATATDTPAVADLHLVVDDASGEDG